MAFTQDTIESERLTIQAQLDRQKSAADRNTLGQFATPGSLAREILAYGVSLLPPAEKIRFLDPAIGTGAFYSALSATCPSSRIEHAAGFEIDPHYGVPSYELWRAASLDYILADFTRQIPDPRYNLVICNPPYVRHHHLSQEDKLRLQHQTLQSSGLKLNGLAGLYCHFLGQSHAWMADGAIAGWLIPSEFMDVNYGKALKRYLLEKVTLLHIHRFDPDDVQFDDALVSSVIVWFKNTPPSASSAFDHRVNFTFGGSLNKPGMSRTITAEALREEAKWTRFPREPEREANIRPTIGDFFNIKRGIATGGNRFFILGEADVQEKGIPRSELRPILPSPRYIQCDIVEADDAGDPVLDHKMFLLDTRLNESEIEREHPALWSYLENGRHQGVHEGYICRHRPIWYMQDKRPAPPIVCTYLGRGSKRNARPFRFIRNRSQATVANVYLAMYPTPLLKGMLDDDPDLLDRLWRSLNEINIAHMIGEGRVYGGKLHKLEPKELANVPLADYRQLCPEKTISFARSPTLFDSHGGDA